MGVPRTPNGRRLLVVSGLRLIDLAESETPDLIDAVVAAVVKAIREVAAEHGWSRSTPPISRSERSMR